MADAAGETRPGTVRRAVVFSGLEKVATQAILLLTTAVMARLLTPAETGLYLVANALLVLAENFRDFGTGIYLVQHPDPTRAVVRAAFTATLVVSLVVAGAILAGAGPVAGFYGDPELAGLLVIGAAAFAVVPFASPVLALMRRELRFRTLAAINLAAAVVNGVVAIGLGAAGVGAASYVVAYVLANVALAGLALLLHPAGATFVPTRRGVRAVLSFGTVSAGVTLVNMAYDLLPRLALGRILGFDAVGLYARALTLCQLPERAFIVALHPVVLPALAAQARAGLDLSRSYLRAVGLLSGLQLPALAMMALLADPIVRVLLGAQWHEAAPLVRLVALGLMALAPGFMTYPLLVAAGRIRAALTMSLVSLPPSALVLILAAPYGVVAVAAATLVTGPLQIAVALLTIRRVAGIRPLTVLAALRPSLVVTAATVAGPGLIVALSPSGTDLSLAESAAAVVVAGVGWAAAIRLTRHPLADELAAFVRMAPVPLPWRRA